MKTINVYISVPNNIDYASKFHSVEKYVHDFFDKFCEYYKDKNFNYAVLAHNKDMVFSKRIEKLSLPNTIVVLAGILDLDDICIAEYEYANDLRLYTSNLFELNSVNRKENYTDELGNKSPCYKDYFKDIYDYLNKDKEKRISKPLIYMGDIKEKIDEYQKILDTKDNELIDALFTDLEGEELFIFLENKLVELKYNLHILEN